MLTPDHPGQRVAVSRHVLEPGAATGGAPMHGAGSREFALVERGAVTLELDGSGTPSRPGDSVMFDADLAAPFSPATRRPPSCPSSAPGCRRS